MYTNDRPLTAEYITSDTVSRRFKQFEDVCVIAVFMWLYVFALSNVSIGNNSDLRKILTVIFALSLSLNIRLIRLWVPLRKNDTTLIMDDNRRKNNPELCQAPACTICTMLSKSFWSTSALIGGSRALITIRDKIKMVYKADVWNTKAMPCLRSVIFSSKSDLFFIITPLIYDNSKWVPNNPFSRKTIICNIVCQPYILYFDSWYLI